MASQPYQDDLVTQQARDNGGSVTADTSDPPAPADAAPPKHTFKSVSVRVCQVLMLTLKLRMSVFLVFLVIAFCLNPGGTMTSGWSFTINFAAIVPLAGIIAWSTETLADQIPSSVAALVNATLGNVVELVISFYALKEGQIRIVQTGMLGSILSNLLLVLGSSFMFAGKGGTEQRFNATNASALSSMMLVSCVSLVIPAAMSASMRSKTLIPSSDPNLSEDELSNMLFLSYGTSFILLVLYVVYLLFLHTHDKVLRGQSEKEADVEQRRGELGRDMEIYRMVYDLLLFDTATSIRATGISNKTVLGTPADQNRLKRFKKMRKLIPNLTPPTVPEGLAPWLENFDDDDDDDESSSQMDTSTATVDLSPEELILKTRMPEYLRVCLIGVPDVIVEEEKPPLGIWESILVLTISTWLVAYCSEYLVASIDGVVSSGTFSATFVGIILVPIVGNAAEHFSSVVLAFGKETIDTPVSIAVGSCVQIALGVTPILVAAGYFLDQPMTLDFHVFESVVLLVSVIMVSYLLADGKSNYLEGALCVGTYFIVAGAFYLYPDDSVNTLSNKLAPYLSGTVA